MIGDLKLTIIIIWIIYFTYFYRTSDCVYTIDTSPTVKRLNLTFTDFNTASQDYVTVYL